MKTARLVRSGLVSLAVLGMCVPNVVFAASPAPVPAVVDVALSDGGSLNGRVVDLQGTGTAGVNVSVKSQGREVATTLTGKDGMFSVQGLKGGMYQVTAGRGHGVYRLWSAGTAPPVAQTSAVVYMPSTSVDQNAVVYTGGGLKTLLANPIVIAGVVATAIAVPVALSNSHSGSP